jgi:hypothetical protein
MDFARNCIVESLSVTDPCSLIPHEFNDLAVKAGMKVD